jgi:hypothetical protein
MVRQIITVNVAVGSNIGKILVGKELNIVLKKRV